MPLSLTSLDQLTLLDASLRAKLEPYWITSVEELVTTARASNQRYGSGLVALALALGIGEATLRPLIEAALPLMPPGLSFDVPVQQEYGAGLVLPDDDDDFDAVSFSVPTNLPSVVLPLFALPPPVDQGVRNTCVAFALNAALQVLSQDPTALSAQFLYWAAKAADGLPGDVGTDPFKAALILQSTGVCRELTWPYQPAPRDDQNPGHGPPPPEAHAEAPQRRVRLFHKLPRTSVVQLKTALAAGQPVLIGLTIWEHWSDSWQGSRLGRLRLALPGEARRSGHALCALGYRDDPQAPGGGYFIVRNSWGDSWAVENSDGPGYCHVPYRLIAETGLASVALEGAFIQAPPLPTPEAAPTSATTPLHQGGASPGTVSGELAALYAEATDLKARLDAFVVRLGSLLHAEASAGSPQQPDPSTRRTSDPVGASSGEQSPDSAVGMPLLLLTPSEAPDSEELYPNGLSPDGRPLLRLSTAVAADLARNKMAADPRPLADLHRTKLDAEAQHLGTVIDVDIHSLPQAHWAVVINANEDAALLKAIWPLIAHRMRQMGHAPPSVDFRAGETAAAWLLRHTDNGRQNLKEAWGQLPPVLIYRHDDTVRTWLNRYGVAPGPVDPGRGVPFYLLLLGLPGPRQANDTAFIPFLFQYQLDIFWGVGRLCFTDANGLHRLADYTTYAERLVAFEQRQDAATLLRKEALYVATRHPLDPATIRSADELIQPLARWSSDPTRTPLTFGFAHRLIVGEQATRAQFEALLRGNGDGKAPAILFTATHGLGLPASDDRLVASQGALVWQDWDGVGNVKREHWFAGEDLAALGADAHLEGTMALLFACYGLGCPAYDEFIFDAQRRRPRIAPFPILAQLPQQLLRNGALGVLGHVERAWTFSFTGIEGARAQSQAFEDLLGRLMRGWRVGHATDQFNVNQAERASALVQELENTEFIIANGGAPDNRLIARLWMARNDARNYLFLGDPAARLPFAEES
ncbi:C1 family peptidase [Candidatus Chloroploca sp. Khr17]|uniref:C1 family peptidase n=1 Tax=Candidatus Chloroploca sp. Khr17 TaxID=2496869 RepID=UPI00101BCDC5|nr:C1 family peptidase [Candidatus Chloroploca sp. Khr17]